MTDLPTLSRASLSAFEALEHPVWVFSLDSLRILASNKAAQGWLGYSKQELEALSILDLRPEEERAALRDYAERLRHDVVDSRTWTIIDKAGARRVASFGWQKIVLDETIAVVATINDTTKLSRNESANVQARRQFETLSSQVRRTEAIRLQQIATQIGRLGAWRFVLDSQKLYWSAETAAIHEEAPHIEPTVEQGISYYAPEYRDRIRRMVTACVEEGRSFDDVLQIISARGKRIWVRVIGEAVRDEQGNVVAVEGAFQDISELVAMHNKAEALSRRLHQTLDHISDAFFLLDGSWRFSFINRRAEVLLQRGREDLLGRVVWEEFPEAVGSLFQQHYQRAVEENQKVQFRDFFAPLDAWFEVNAYPTPEGLAVYFRDITTAREKDEQLRLLGNAVSQLNDILLITQAAPIDGPDGPRIVYVNDAFVKRTGYSRDEVIGQTPRLLQGPGTQRVELDKIRFALERSQAIRTELINYTKTGEKIWMELNIVPVANEAGECTHMVAVQRDVTERKAAEELTRLNEERFLLVTRATNDVIWDWDLATETLWWNDNLKTMLGHDPAPVEPGLVSWTKHVHPDDKDRVLESIHAAIDGTASNWASEYRFFHAAGHALTVVDRGFIMRNDDGQAVRMVGSMMDVTELQEMERKLQQSQKLEAVGQLTGGVAHDFNNLLTVILGNSELLHEQLGDRPQLASLAEMLAAAAERGAELTSRLLAFSRKQSLAPRLVDVNTLISGVERLLQRTLGEHITIKVVREIAIWLAEIDSAQLEAALLNLAINARDAMPRGGNLVIETRNTILDEQEVTAEPGLSAGQYVEIAVSDTGHGMTRDVLERVFEPFFTTKEVGKGSGLGLSMVYGFAKQSGGHIRIVSQPDEGTSVSLYFPRSNGEGKYAQGNPIKPSIVGGSELILVVEDDALVRQNVMRQLRGLGYRVVEAGSGAEALEVLKKTPQLDLLLSDVVMPGGMNGWELATAAKATRPGLKVLLTSGYAEHTIASRVGLDFNVDLLLKPYRRTQLATKVREALRDS